MVGPNHLAHDLVDSLVHAVQGWQDEATRCPDGVAGKVCYLCDDCDAVRDHHLLHCHIWTSVVPQHGQGLEHKPTVGSLGFEQLLRSHSRIRL